MKTTDSTTTPTQDELFAPIDAAADADAIFALEETTGRGKRALVTGLIAALVIGALGLITAALGLGPFGYRVIRYGEVQVSVYNGTPDIAHVEIDGVHYSINPFSGTTVGVVGGEVTFETSLEPIEDQQRTHQRVFFERNTALVQGDRFVYHVATPESNCLALADMTSYYRSGEVGTPRIVGSVTKDERLRPLDAGAVLFTRDTLPDKVGHVPLIWMATMPCETLSEPALVETTLKVRAQEYREALKARRDKLAQRD